VVAVASGDREQLWSDLMSESETAYRAQWGLADSAGLAAFLRAKIGGRVPLSEAKRITQLIEDLDDSSFRTRETALTELYRLGRVAEPAVREALAKTTSAEQKLRLEGIVARFDKGLSPDELRMRRSVQALTWSNDSEAVELLTEWASGMAGAPLTESAKAALHALKTVP
jgi:hypothetical protein